MRAAHDFYETPAVAAQPVMLELARLWSPPTSWLPPSLRHSPHILDAGAGRGALTRAARSAFGSEAFITAVELNDDVVETVQGDIFEAAVHAAAIAEGQTRLEATLHAAGASAVLHEDYFDQLCAPGLEVYRGADAWDRVDVVVSNPPFTLASEFLDHTISNLKPTLAAFLLRLNFLGSRLRRPWWDAHPPDAQRVLTDRPDFTGAGGDSIEYAWFIWSTNAAISADLHRHPIGWY